MTQENNVIRVLIIEDNDEDAYQAVQSLNAVTGGKSFISKRVRTLAEALQELKSYKFDAALLDLGLPDAQGLESLLKINEVAPDLRISILTASGDPEKAEEAIKNGAEDYLVKCDDLKTLDRRMRMMIARANSNDDSDIRLELNLLQNWKEEIVRPKLKKLDELIEKFQKREVEFATLKERVAIYVGLITLAVSAAVTVVINSLI